MEEQKKYPIESIIRQRMARHYKRLEERLNCLNLNVVAWETISREWRFLEQDLIEDCKAVENGTYKQF